MTEIEQLAALIRVLSRLPALGRRSAERIALRLVRDRDGLLKDLIQALGAVRETIRECSLCGGITTRDRNPCPLCSDQRRDDSHLCVVESPSDQMIIERSGAYRGRYFVLHGKLSPREGLGPDNPRIRRLLERVTQRGVQEVILALGMDVESEATMSFLASELEKRGIRVSHLAYGIPAGSGVAYVDDLTLKRAIVWRQPVRPE
ncbi:MAG TPA: recombination protein RecR [Kiritimatiellae bacterium]|nr:recombination protein RecR [Kiritimatiellia bacterium]